MSSAMLARGHGQASDDIVEPALVQPSIRGDRVPMQWQDSASFSSHACYDTIYTDIVRGYATFDNLLIIYYTLAITIIMC